MALCMRRVRSVSVVRQAFARPIRVKVSAPCLRPRGHDGDCSYETCDAIPLGGDGSLVCDLPPKHCGLHEGDGYQFRRVKPGSSPRSPKRTKLRFAASAHG